MSKLLARLKKNSVVENAAMLSKSELFKNNDFIRLPVPMMNLAFSGKLKGGFSNGLVQLAGPSKHFKSNMALVLVKAFQEKHEDGVVIFYDSEFGSSDQYFENAGIDIDRVLHTPLMNIEEFKIDCIKQLEAIEDGDKVLILIDSVGNLASKKEIEDALNEKSVADMTRAKQLKSCFRMFTPYLTLKKVPMIAINHTYQTQETYSKTIVSGGCLTEGTMIQMGDGSLKAVENISVGDFVKTLSGQNEVTHVWDHVTLDEGEPECVEVEMEDGFKVVCSWNHPFLVQKLDGTRSYVPANQVTEEMYIVSI